MQSGGRKPADSFEPSPHQRRVLDFVRSGTGHGVVRATAGSGKTTTLEQVAGILPEDLALCFLAFGKATAKELKDRLPARVETRTTHSLGLRALRAELNRRGVPPQELDKRKYARMVSRTIGDLAQEFAVNQSELKTAREYLERLVEFARLNLTDTKDLAAVRRLATQYNLVPPASYELEAELYKQLRSILREGVRAALEEGLFDFTDELYVTQVHRLPVRQFDFVCVDEAQDYSAVALEFTMRLVDEQSGGRLLFVGDPRQSLYGFAGADTDALDRIINRTNATILPLSVSYRCPRSHMELARQIAPEARSRPGAPEGKIYWIKDHALPKWVRAGDMILCRSNGPLVRTCLRLVRGGLPAVVVGHELPKQIIDLSKRAFAKGFADYADRLDRFAAVEEHRLRKSARASEAVEGHVADRLDLIECLSFIANDVAETGALSLDAIEARVEQLFGDSRRAVQLSSVHRAKGQEADRVFIYHPNLMPATYARTAEAIRGEECVQFVALTRARRDLVFVESPPPEPFFSLAAY